ncbi:MAG: hypothetical protein WKF54_12580 [Nocardioidaceae bacterium]
MYLITTNHATSVTTRFRMPVLCLEGVTEALKRGRRIAGLVSHRYGAAAPASFKDATSGVRAWSPPV